MHFLFLFSFVRSQCGKEKAFSAASKKRVSKTKLVLVLSYHTGSGALQQRFLHLHSDSECGVSEKYFWIHEFPTRLDSRQGLHSRLLRPVVQKFVCKTATARIWEWNRSENLLIEDTEVKFGLTDNGGQEIRWEVKLRNSNLIILWIRVSQKSCVHGIVPSNHCIKGRLKRFRN